MGTVYRARDDKLTRDIAIKVLGDAMTDDPKALTRFAREARAVAALNHPHVVTIFSTEEADGMPFITMELIEGRTLDQLIHPGGLDLTQFFDIAIALADALASAHAKHITHRDLKGTNVMVSDDGRVKVLDFGLARHAEPERVSADDLETRSAVTRQGTIVGTLPYMSPEQIEGRPLDPRTDIFSFGILLYEMAAGQRPFRGDSSPALLSSILKDHPTPVVQLRDDIPFGVSRLIARCLEKSPRDRIQSATEILAELRGYRAAWESGAMSEARAHPHSTEPGRVASIAVLAFKDMSALKDQDWFCDGIAEEILNALTPLDGLRVAARTSAFSFKGRNDDLQTIGRQLNVATVLEGSVRRAGDRVRITVQLSDVRDGYQLWSERYDRELKDIFDVQDEIAKSIVDRLRVTFTGDRNARLLAKPTPNVEAYQLYLRGRALLDRRGANVPAGLELLKQAVELDPGYSLAWAGIADGFTVLSYAGAAAASETKAPAMTAALRSIELDPTSAQGHTALACATLVFENNRARAAEEFERAITLNPQYSLGRVWYALFDCVWARGDFERGIAEARRALNSDPLSAYVMTNLGICLLTAGRLEEAVDVCHRAVQQDSGSFVAQWAFGISLGQAGRFDEAISLLESAAVMSNRHTLALTALAGVFGPAGRPMDARKLHRELLDRAPRQYASPSHLTLTAEAAGDRSAALAFARRAWDDRDPNFILWARHFPQYRALRSDPVFAAILREMDQPVWTI
jgi:serine/threonine-protein kinase